MYFTKNDIKQLLDVLKLNSKKDTEFEVANDLVGDENIALIQKGENKISTLNHLSSFVLKDITYDLNAEKTARENADKVHDDALTTHTKQITTLQTKVQDVIVVNTEQQTAINSQGIRLTEVEHRADEHDTKIAQINTDMKQMDDNILRHGEEIEDLQDADKVFNNKITTLQTKVQEVINVNNEQHATITSIQQIIENLTTRIEALEKGGGGSSADVESGTLSASASVVNEVMSVQGSVEDGILKL